MRRLCACGVLALTALLAPGVRAQEGAEIPQPLLAAMHGSDPVARWDAIAALARQGSAAVPGLVAALASPRERVRQAAAIALGRIGPAAKPAEAALLAALQDKDGDVREMAAQALGRTGADPATAVPALASRLWLPQPYVCGRVAETLAGLGADAVPELVRALAGADVEARRCASIALGRLGGKAREAVPALVGALRESDGNARWNAAIALGEIGEGAREAAPALLEVLSDRDEDVRWGAEWAIERVDPGALARAAEWEAVTAAVERLVPALMTELHVPGVSVALVRKGELAWSRSFGVVDAGRSERVTAETMFEACSMSKTVLATLAMKLVEQGRLDLDRPLCAYLDEQAVPAQPERCRITARMALSHTTGLPNWRPGGEERLGPLPVRFEPGSRFAYSGEGIYLLQRAVERIADEPLEVHAHRTLFAPMGLRRTSFVRAPGLERFLASGHGEDGGSKGTTRYLHANAAYSLYVSADDFARLISELLRPGREVPWSLSRGSVEAMLGRQVALDTRDPIERPGRARGLRAFWGLGWGVNATAEGDIAYHSGANSSGFRCYSQLSPSRGTGIVIMTNGMGGGELWTRVVAAIGHL